MKKILFTLLLVATSFVAQAQNTLTFGSWVTGGQTYGLIVSEEGQACFDDSQMAETQVLEYTWNTSTNILTINGTEYAATGDAITNNERDFGTDYYLLLSLTSDRRGLGDTSLPQPTPILAN